MEVLIFLFFSAISSFSILFLGRRFYSSGLRNLIIIIGVFGIAFATGEIGYDIKDYNASLGGFYHVGQSMLSRIIFILIIFLSGETPFIGRLILLSFSGLTLFFLLRNTRFIYLPIVYSLLVTFLWGNFKMQLAMPFVFIFLSFISSHYTTKKKSDLLYALFFFAIAVLLHQSLVILFPVLLLSLRNKAMTIPTIGVVIVLLLFSYSELIMYVNERVIRYFSSEEFMLNSWTQRLLEIILNLIILFFYLSNKGIFKQFNKPLYTSVVLFHLLKIALNIFDISSHIQGRGLLPFYLLDIFLILELRVFERTDIKKLMYLRFYSFVRIAGVLFGSFRYALYDYSF